MRRFPIPSTQQQVVLEAQLGYLLQTVGGFIGEGGDGLGFGEFWPFFMG
jgi:hypothetical protein